MWRKPGSQSRQLARSLHDFIYRPLTYRPVSEPLFCRRFFNLFLRDDQMMDFRFVLLFIFLPGTLLLFAQPHRKPEPPQFTISGFVEDATSGEKLIGANVYDPNRLEGTTSNVYGFFSLTLPADTVTLAVAYIGYETEFLRIPLNRDLQLTVRLQPTGVRGDTVQVTAERIELIEEQTLMSRIDVPVAQIRSLPALLGETDVLKTLQLLPGVQSGNEGTSGIYVRGGGPDQNLILLDGAPVYNASHLFGFFSVFNADAIKNVQLTRGGFPARFGGRLSSVVEINMKEGNNQQFHGAAAIGVVATRLTVEGPLRRGRASYIISARRTYIDVLARPFISDENGTGGYFFYDLNAKLNHTFSDKSRVFFSIYTGDDQFSAEEKSNGRTDFKAGLGWGNITSTLRWNYVLNKKLFSNTTLTFSKYRFDIQAEDRDSRFDDNTYVAQYFSGIRDWSARVDFDYIPNPRHYIKFGGDVIYHTFSPGAYQYNEETTGGEAQNISLAPSGEIDATEASLYLEDDIKLSKGFAANLGLHASTFWVKGTTYASFQPRLSLRYQLNGGWALKGSWANMRQYIHLLTNSGIGLPTDLWVPATDRVRPQQAWQTALGVARSLWDQRYEFSIEGYYKRMSHLIEYKEGADFLGLDRDWQEKVEVGRGDSYGVELFLQKKQGRTTGWLGYTLSWSDRRFAAFNDGKTFPYRYDRRHDLSLVMSHALSDRWELSGTFVFGSGAAVTLPVGRLLLNTSGAVNPFFGFGQEVLLYGERNSFRMRSYHRADLSLRWHRSKKRDGGVFAINVYNIYNRKNPYFLFLDFDDNGNRVMKQVSLFPIIPSVSYSFTF